MQSRGTKPRRGTRGLAATTPLGYRTVVQWNYLHCGIVVGVTYRSPDGAIFHLNVDDINIIF